MSAVDIEEARKWIRLHERNKYQREAARRMTSLVDEIERVRAERDELRALAAHDAEVAAKAKAEERERIARDIRAHRFDVWDERRIGPDSFYAGMTEAVRIARKDQP